MTEQGGAGRDDDGREAASERLDPRFDPAFQRGFGGGVERVRADDRPFARPGTRPEESASGAFAPRARRAGPALPEIAAAADSRREHRERRETAAGRLPAPASDEPSGQSQSPAVSPREAPLLRNPWLLVLLLAGLAGSVVGAAMVYAGYAAPSAPYYGDSDTPSPEYIQRQLVYYASIPLLGCLPFSVLIALGVAALRWRGRPVRPALEPDAPRVASDEDGEESRPRHAPFGSGPGSAQTPEAPNSSPSR
ncbi:MULTISPECIES: hypothetical protein [unclassified Rathayibacter]|uniref:hypothetical protein n=1 Tax=unclassified Rathayibacter TaxID=2609250 RepID=UPI00188C36AE|nr:MULTISPECIES: hypothetical protein [unclassified Rathayibacter]MBF4461544.1 hypothetical protein [Rathayibacter sp. VKM Ac-2879]MBF4502955.1 hypothetical protein [Rathayibacter sp. VKM Ac-2878]